jgi:uncharacterized protein (UPF0332 family)
MFDAARAALTATQKLPESEAIKTHGGLIFAFSLHLVKTGHVSVELGKSFSEVADIRLVADYSDEEVTPDRVKWAIEPAACGSDAPESVVVGASAREASLRPC